MVEHDIVAQGSARGQASNGEGSPGVPTINLPKGGGAIRSIGEKFAVNPVTGSGATTVPIYASPSRSGFGPQLALSYDSGSGNGPFGLGWTISLPSITRKTDKGLPQYDGESDVFLLAGAEDLVPVLRSSDWTPEVTPPRTIYGQQYAIRRYRPRIEGLFARIERWVNQKDPQDTFWRTISKDNVTTWYGRTAESRVYDPDDPSRVFTWFVCESYDAKGNVISYAYKAEDSDGVDVTQASERNRTDLSRSARRYPKRVLYGNRTPYFPDLNQLMPVPLPSDWCFELVFDYGEHDIANPLPQDAGHWTCRPDPFSTYRSTFEVRTYRLCRRVLMFHDFAGEANVGLHCLVRSTDLAYCQPSGDPVKPFFSYLVSITQTGYTRDGAGGYVSRSMPPLEFEYSDAELDETVREFDRESLENLPAGTDGANYRWVDLNGEGLSGILTEQGGSWFYKANLSPANRQTVGGVEMTLPRFAPVEVTALQPAGAALNAGRQRLLDLSGDGQLDLVQFAKPASGFYERTEDADWEPFRAFRSVPVVDWRDPNLRFIDLTGDGLPDLLLSEENALSWHTSLGDEGFAEAKRVSQSVDEETGPKLVFADGTESIFLADMSGDGLTDLVRICNGEVCYWPNRGYGRFGAKVTMEQAPRFDTADQFDGRRIRLADIDGSGSADIIYFAAGAIHLYFNRSGNSWGARRVLSNFPTVESVSSATAMDLLGNGTACLVWSSPLAPNSRRPMRYVDLMGGMKPHLMVRMANNLGAETLVRYAPSTKFYVADKLAGTPWVTRLPFPIHVVEQVATYDYVSRSLFTTRYAYHHGYFDGAEREFRGFGRVDQRDTEEFAALANTGNFPQPLNVDASSHVPPVLTKTWYHTGAFIGADRISKYLEHEYYSEGDASEGFAGLTPAQAEAMLLDDTVLPTTILLADATRAPHEFSGEEMQEACRALKGSVLREEIYALDGTDEEDRPYSVSERNYTVEALQPRGTNPHAVFSTHPREAINFHYERKLFHVTGSTLSAPGPPPVRTAADPRVTHSVTLAADAFGNVLESVAVGYGRRYLDSDLTPADQQKQGTLLCTYTESSYTNPVDGADTHRTPLPAASDVYELFQAQPAANLADVTNLFRFTELKTIVQVAQDGAHDIAFENSNPAGLNAGEPYRRLLGRTRVYYRPDDMGAAAEDPRALLPLRTLETLALAGESFKLGFTPGLIAQVYQRGGAALLPVPANVLGSAAGDGGGYLDLDGDGHWWIPSGRLYFLPTGPSLALERAQAIQHFFLPRSFEDPFGNLTSVDYDAPHDLLLVRTRDAVNNVVSSINDYRVLAPATITDANGNRAAVSFDSLGLVTATAVMGKPGENLGDLLTGFVTDVPQAQLDAFHDAADPHGPAAGLVGDASTRVVYDVGRFHRSRLAAPADPSQWLPAWGATIARETHHSALAPGGASELDISFSYSDGFSREIQKKIQAEPLTAAPANPNWVASGWTIFNNKGKPVRQYEPFFSQLPARKHQFEFGVATGVSPIFCYDPLGRTAITIRPNRTYEKVVFDPWHSQNFDANDNVARDDPTTDPDVGGYFQRLPAADCTPTWRVARAGGGMGAQEQSAAAKAAAHANTPATVYLDALGRTFLTVADNAGAGKYETRVELDIQGNQRSLTDALGRQVMRFDSNLTSETLHQSGMDGGERWLLNDAAGKGIRAWDSRGHNFRTEYDPVRRPLHYFVRGVDPANSDSRTTAAEVMFEKFEYGEGVPGDEALNLRTRVFRHRDVAGVMQNTAPDPVTGNAIGFDFKGNLLRGSRKFLRNHDDLPDWSGPDPAFLGDLWIGATEYDARNRIVSTTMPDGTIIRPAYNQAGLLESLGAHLLGAAAATPFVANIDYNAKGQRTLIEYGDEAAPMASAVYTYDPLTFRVANLTTTRAGFPADQAVVQNLSYTYDPTGNIIHIQDDADIHNVVFFQNRRVEPSADYTYDAIYRLILAGGREHLGLGGGGAPLAPAATSYNDVPRARLPHPGDGNAMGTYSEQFAYDEVGNLESLTHTGSDPTNPGWTRTYFYNEPSQLEPGKVNNRLTRTSVSGAVGLNEPYTHNVHGNFTSMPQLQVMQWNFKDQLRMTRRQAVNPADADGAAHAGERTFYVYDGKGERVRKTTVSATGAKTKERFYLSALEVYREYDGAGNVTLERHTLHVMDDKRRVALVETKLVEAGAPPGSLPSSQIRFQFDNQLGSACLELDETAGVITYEEYYPFGSTSYQAGRSLAEVSLKRFRYTALERDEETGLYYHGARYYAAWLGRWVSCDPIGVSAGVNVYQFCRNSPTNLSDPNGMDPPNDAGYRLTPLLTDYSLTGVSGNFQFHDLFSSDRSVSGRGAIGATLRASFLLDVPRLDLSTTGIADISGLAAVDTSLGRAGVRLRGGGVLGDLSGLNLAMAGTATLRIPVPEQLRLGDLPGSLMRAIPEGQGDVRLSGRVAYGNIGLVDFRANASLAEGRFQGHLDATSIGDVGRLRLDVGGSVSPEGRVSLGSASLRATVNVPGINVEAHGSTTSEGSLNLSGSFRATALGVPFAFGSWSFDPSQGISGFSASGHYFGPQFGPLGLNLGINPTGNVSDDTPYWRYRDAVGAGVPASQGAVQMYEPGTSFGYSYFSYSATNRFSVSVGVSPSSSVVPYYGGGASQPGIPILGSLGVGQSPPSGGVYAGGRLNLSFR